MQCRIAFVALLSLTLILSFTGCTGDNPDAPMQGDAYTVYPVDGARDVNVSMYPSIIFSKPVDRATVERNFHLISERDMADSTCPMGMGMGHGMMDSSMMSSGKMSHIMAQHRTAGRFRWNTDGTMCTFMPDSAMRPSTRYMMHFGEEMMQMMRDRMGDMGSMMMMGGNGSGEMAGHMFMHFRTADSTRTGGGGHLGHH